MSVAPRDLRGLLEHIGLTYIKERGDEIWASCPSHHDSGDSWSINRRTGMHSCFACGHAGSLQTLVMEELDVDNFKANRLIRQFGVEDILDYLEEADRQRSQLTEEEVYEDPFRPAPMSMAARFSTFIDPPDEALAKRKISRESAETFGLRWKPPSTWVLPIRSPGGRLMGWEEKSPTFVFDRPRGINTSETVFGAERLRWCETVILVESPLDACRLHTLGYEDVFASFGAVVSDPQMRLLSEYAQEIVLALDNDEAGDENMARLASGLRYAKNGRVVRTTPWMAHKRIKIIDYRKGDGKDVGEMSEDRIAESLDQAVAANLWVQKIERLNHDVHREAHKPKRGFALPSQTWSPLAKSKKRGSGPESRSGPNQSAGRSKRI